MVRNLPMIVLAGWLLSARAAPPPPAPPQVAFGELFAAVQMARLFADGKEFADAVPKIPPVQILADYRRHPPLSAEALRQFVAANFDLPARVTAPTAAAERVPIDAHIDQLWDILTRRTPAAPHYSSLLALPRPYVVPGGRFREVYYWDSYFTMLGLLQSGRRDLAEDMVHDFAYLIDRFGHVPNGTRTYYLSRSQPPFFFRMLELLSGDDPAAAYASYLPQLKLEYAFWMHGAAGLRPGQAHARVVAMPDGSLLNRYWDDRDTPRDESYFEDTELARTSGREPRKLYRDIRAAAESGWDFSSRWFADGQNAATMITTQIVPIDLNSLLWGLERAIESGCARRHEVDCERMFRRRAARRCAAIDRYLWDAVAGAYLDYRWTQHARIQRISAATLYPLFVGIASASQTDTVAVTTERLLLRGGGVVTTPLTTGQQWDAPNGWAPIQWIAVEGLVDRHPQLAATIGCRWMRAVNRIYRDNGKLEEKYDVVDLARSGGGGEYPNQDGFGWTNGVMRALSARWRVQSPAESASMSQPDDLAACKNSATSAARMQQAVVSTASKTTRCALREPSQSSSIASAC